MLTSSQPRGVRGVSLSEAGGGGHWITLHGGDEEEGGGVHVFVGAGGQITKGPASLIGAKAGHITAHHEAQGGKVTHHPDGHTPKGATDHPAYEEKTPGKGKPYARTESARDTGLTKEQAEAGLHKAIAQKRLAGGPEEQIKQAFEDWHSGRLHLDRAGKNYRLRPDAPTATDHGPSGGVAPYNKLLKARFKDVGEFHDAATAAKKTATAQPAAPEPKAPTPEPEQPSTRSEQYADKTKSEYEQFLAKSAAARDEAKAANERQAAQKAADEATRQKLAAERTERLKAQAASAPSKDASKDLLLRLGDKSYGRSKEPITHDEVAAHPRYAEVAADLAERAAKIHATPQKGRAMYDAFNRDQVLRAAGHDNDPKRPLTPEEKDLISRVDAVTPTYAEHSTHAQQAVRIEAAAESVKRKYGLDRRSSSSYWADKEAVDILAAHHKAAYVEKMRELGGKDGLKLHPEMSHAVDIVRAHRRAKQAAAAGLQEATMPDDTEGQVPLFEADLSAKKRDSLKDSQFAYVDDEGEGHLPLPDAAHVRNALARFDQTDMPDSARAGALRKIKAAAKRFGVEVSEAVDLAPPDDDEEETGPDTDDDPLGQVGAHLEKDAHHPDRLVPKKHHTRGRDGKYNGSEVVLHKGSGPRTAARMSESVALSEAGTDRARREVLLQIISPGFGSSRDPKSGLPVYYTAQALQEAAPLFARKKCYLNHSTPAERKSRPEGDITRWGATVKEAWWDTGRQALVGRTRVVNSNLWEAIELDPDEVAVSIHAHGNGRTGTAEGKNAWLVESIDAVHSVDFVTYAGARGGVIQVLESDRAAVRFTETEQREAERDMFEDITERDLRESRPDLVEAIIVGQKPVTPAVDLTEALRPYEERVHLLECELNRRDARSLVEKALSACGLPAPAAERLRVQFSEATYGLPDSPYESGAALVEAVGMAGKAEAEYIKSVSAPARAITGMGASTPATVTTAAGGRTPTAPADRTVLREAQTRLDALLRPVGHKAPPPKDDAGIAAAGAAPAYQSRMDSLLRGTPAKG